MFYYEEEAPCVECETPTDIGGAHFGLGITFEAHLCKKCWDTFIEELSKELLRIG